MLSERHGVRRLEWCLVLQFALAVMLPGCGTDTGAGLGGSGVDGAGLDGVGGNSAQDQNEISFSGVLYVTESTCDGSPPEVETTVSVSIEGDQITVRWEDEVGTTLLEEDGRFTFSDFTIERPDADCGALVMNVVGQLNRDRTPVALDFTAEQRDACCVILMSGTLSASNDDGDSTGTGDGTDACDGVVCVDDGLFCNGTEYCSDGVCVSTGDPCGPGETCSEALEWCLAEPAAQTSLLVRQGDIINRYGGSNWTTMTTILNDEFDGEIEVVTSLADVDAGDYAALWVDLGGNDAALSSAELATISSFISAGKRVALIGENDDWGEWSAQILGVVGGSYNGEAGGDFETDTWAAHDLTSSVTEVRVEQCGLAVGGTSLFETSFATLWGSAVNVLTVLDTDVFDDGMIGSASNYIFAQNVAEWLHGGGTTDPCSDVTCVDDGLFCNGTEYCSDGVCVSTGDPCVTGETCDELLDECVSDAPSGSSLLVRQGHIINRYTGLNWLTMTTILNDEFDGEIEVVTSLADVDAGDYAALWVDLGGNDAALSSAELTTISSFISAGKRVALIGENDDWGGWSAQILGVVGGSYGGEAGGDFETSAILSHALSAGVAAVRTEQCGLAVGGTSLFETSFATLWGSALNVLTVLDTDVFDDGMIGSASNYIFAQNVAEWLHGGGTTDPCSDVTCVDDGLFCNGTEYCSDGVCVSTGDPCVTGETCDELLDECVSDAPSGSSLLVRQGHIINRYTGLNWLTMTTILNDEFDGEIEVVTSLADVDAGDYAALWVDLGGNDAALSSAELTTISSFISAGKRVALIGENDDWGGWSAQILGVVGGSYGGEAGGDFETSAILSHALSAGVAAVRTEQCGLAVGGTSLFETSFATLWGSALNVLTVLDTDVFDDGMIGSASNYIFAQNVAEWLHGGGTTDPCSDVTCVDDGLFCNGTEYCSDGVCVSTGDPCVTGETCDELLDECVSDAPSGSSLLVREGDIINRYGGSNWTTTTTILNDEFDGEIEVVTSLADVDAGDYAALWVDLGGNDAALSSAELTTISSFISAGKRVALIGENDDWGGWSAQILGVVGGSYGGEAGGDFETSAILSHALSAGVAAVRTEQCGLAVGGTSLFETSFATLWGSALNVLTVLDTDVFDDGMIGSASNYIFAQNVAEWLKGE
jgi:hypothetical protein